MLKLYPFIIAISLLGLQSCNHAKPKTPIEKISELADEDGLNIGNQNYQFELPKDWYRLDTVISSVKICALIENTDTLRPIMNVSTELMEGRPHSEYVLSTRKYLQLKNDDIEVMGKGEFSFSGKKCLWYSYNMIQNGKVREMIFYSIAIGNISYNITAGVNSGGRAIYEKTFQGIVKSFRLMRGIIFPKCILIFLALFQPLLVLRRSFCSIAHQQHMNGQTENLSYKRNAPLKSGFSRRIDTP